MLTLEYTYDGPALALALAVDEADLYPAARTVLGRVASGGKTAIRQALRGAGLRGLANAVRSEVHALKGELHDVQARIFSKAIVKRAGGLWDLVEVFAEGATIRPIRGQWLAIPKPAAGRGRGRRRYPQTRDFPPDFFRAIIARDGRSGALVPRTDHSPKPQAYFILVKTVTLHGRFDLDRAVAPALADVTGQIVKEWERRRQRQAA